MIIYPAIDIRQNKCVRLYQGDYQRETVYNADPFSVAKEFVSAGANWLHIVDLDAAKNPDQAQVTLMTELIKTNNINIQIGGGIRTKSQIQRLLAVGAKCVIIGSMAIKKKEEVLDWFKYFGADKLVLALDVIINIDKQSKVCVNAWQDISKYSLYDLIDFYQPAGLTHLLCTNIALDGTLNGPDYELYDSILSKYPFIKLQASGGIRSLSDIITLNKKGLSGVVIGRALYENKFTLREVLSC